METKNIKTVNHLWLPFYVFCLHSKKIQKAAFSINAIVPARAAHLSFLSCPLKVLEKNGECL